MQTQAFNPFLPSYEYIPDGEPYVIGDRLYIYGSHDRFGGEGFCLNHYVCWSAPTGDLANWRYEGVIYKNTQHPGNEDGSKELPAPDMQQGPDGRYYLYYAISGVMAVAVSDTPAGEYEFYGLVQYPDGTVIGTTKGDISQFDPGVLVDEDGRVYLYSGFAPDIQACRKLEETSGMRHEGAYFMELMQDMLTVKRGPTVIVPRKGDAAGTGFEGHEFFEASSIRKISGKYYFIYSSINYHELCYATSDRPDGGFVYGGTIVSNGDIGYKGRQWKDMINYAGNNHGSIVEVKGQWYVFYHRQTDLRHFSRQACGEPIFFEADGSIMQVEITSCGLNNKPLAGTGQYEARIACNLMSVEGAFFYTMIVEDAGIHPYFTQDGPDREQDGNQYIANMQDGAVAGFKYFEFENTQSITVTLRGEGVGRMVVAHTMGGTPIGEIAITPRAEWAEFSAPICAKQGVQALYFTFCGEGKVDFSAFSLM